jgi:hypothetical protein
MFETVILKIYRSPVKTGGLAITNKLSKNLIYMPLLRCLQSRNKFQRFPLEKGLQR